MTPTAFLSIHMNSSQIKKLLSLPRHPIELLLCILLPSIHDSTELAGQIISLLQCLFLRTKIPWLPTAKRITPKCCRPFKSSHNLVPNTFLVSCIILLFHTGQSPDPWTEIFPTSFLTLQNVLYSLPPSPWKALKGLPYRLSMQKTLFLRSNSDSAFCVKPSPNSKSESAIQELSFYGTRCFLQLGIHQSDLYNAICWLYLLTLLNCKIPEGRRPSSHRYSITSVQLSLDIGATFLHFT